MAGRNKVELELSVDNNASRQYKKFSREITSANKRIVTSSKAVELQSGKTSKSFISAITAQKAVVIGLAGLLTGKFTQSFISAQKNVDRINNALLVGTGTTALAAKEFAFLERQSNRLGLELQSTALSYAQLTAAAKNTNLTAMEQREIFLGVSEAGAALGLSAADMAGALRAVQQMISKGNVQAEELRGQLGERIPGAFSIAAKAMGLTEKALNKQLELGNILAEDMLPKLAKELRATFGKVAAKGPETLNGKINALKNTIFETQRELLAGGVADILKTGFELAAKAVKILGRNISVLTGVAKALFLVWSAKQFMAIASSIERSYQQTAIATTTTDGYRTKTVLATRAQWGFNRAVKALSFVGPLLAVAAFQFAIDKLLLTMEDATKAKAGKDVFVSKEETTQLRVALTNLQLLGKEVDRINETRALSRGLGVTEKDRQVLDEFGRSLSKVRETYGSAFDPENANIPALIRSLNIVENNFDRIGEKIEKSKKKTTAKDELPVFEFLTVKPDNRARDALRNQLGTLTQEQIDAKKEADAAVLALEEQRILRMQEGVNKELALNKLSHDQERLENQSNFDLLEEMEKTHAVEQQRIRDAADEDDVAKAQKKADEIRAIRIQTAQVILSGAAGFTSAMANLSAVQGANELKAAEAAGESEEQLKEIRKKTFEEQKKFQLASAGMAAGSAVVNALTVQPANLVPVAVAFALATSAVQLAAIDAQKFAHGGIVGGNQFAGDQVTAQVNSGELIATRAQQARLLNLIDGGEGAGGRSTSVQIGDIIVHTQATDAQGIASEIGDTLQEKLSRFGETERDARVHGILS